MYPQVTIHMTTKGCCFTPLNIIINHVHQVLCVGKDLYLTPWFRNNLFYATFKKNLDALIASNNPKSDNGTDLDANSNTSTQANTYNIPVRTNGITEKVSAINEDSFTGVTRNRTARYYLYGISMKSTRNGIWNYLTDVESHDCNFFENI